MRRGSLIGLSCSCVVVAACSAHSNGSDVTGDADAAPGPVTVPLTVTQVATDGSKRFSIPIEVGGSSLDVLLDTGSTGLVILEGAVPDSAFSSITTQAAGQVYGGGLDLKGVYAYASVTIGGLTTPAPIPVIRATTVGCTAASPTCGGAGKTPANETLFGPYRAIMGAGMQNAGTYGSPIAQLPGHPSFIVMASSYGADGGALRINPTREELAAFTTYQLPAAEGGKLANGTPSWDYSQGMPGCVHDETSGISYCEAVFLDSGACPTVIEWPSDASVSEVLPPGSSLEVTIGPASAPLAQYGFTVGQTPVPGVDQVWLETQKTSPGHINAGTGVYFRYRVLWDHYAGVIGLAPQ